MFFLFALISASSFQSVSNAVKVAPTNIALANQKPNDGKLDMVFTVAAKTDIEEDAKLTLKFTEVTASSNAEVTITIAKAAAVVSTGGSEVHTSTNALTGIGGADSLQFGKKYKVTSYQYNAEAAITTTTNLPKEEIEITKPDPLVTFSVVPKTITSLTIKATLEEKAGAAKDVTVTFTPKTKDGKVVTKKFTMAKDATETTADFPLAAAEAADTLVYGEEYTLTLDDASKFRIAGSPITIEDYTKLTITPKLEKEGEKGDGAKDKVSLTFVNSLLPKEVAKENPKQNLKLTTVEKTSSNEDFTLNKAEGIEWTHTAGQLVVKYIYDVAKMNKYPAGDDVKLKATLEVDDLKWEGVEFVYKEGAKTVASVVAALFAVLALVF
ncbi:hypothetical protein BLNAU_10743 [Blattamonas nauphoetae]|uniref:Uncharacterized protein n=1 Tax=Blattamonas nauphoetae TaxID=2049346 RepID=A0ABQ9XR11_9EUKA|nr:hypothetical protein BLNAU_10743 [Blattamonas nauphoetae]